MINYIPRSAAYYAAQGYAPYRWAQHDEVPFTPLTKPLSASRLTLITTSAPLEPGAGDQGPGAAYNAGAKFFEVFARPLEPKPDLRISHIGYDRNHCQADDPATWLPIKALQAEQANGFIGKLAPELIGTPTNRSQRATLENDAPRVLEECKRLSADVVLLVPT